MPWIYRWWRCWWQKRITWTHSVRSLSSQVDTRPSICASCVSVLFIRSTAASCRRSLRHYSPTSRLNRSCSVRVASSAFRSLRSCRRRWSVPWPGSTAPRLVSDAAPPYLSVFPPVSTFSYHPSSLFLWKLLLYRMFLISPSNAQHDLRCAHYMYCFSTFEKRCRKARFTLQTASVAFSVERVRGKY